MPLAPAESELRKKASVFRSGSRAKDALCEEGVQADVVLSITGPSPVPGIGGTGGSCSADQNGRPIHIVFNWYSRYDFSSIPRETLMSSARALVIHEVFHGLGFGSRAWLNAYGSSGERRTLLEQRCLD